MVVSVALAPSPHHPGETRAVSALSFVPADFFDAHEWEMFRGAVARTRELALCAPVYNRHGGAHRTADRPMGSVLVVPPPFRRVPITQGFRAHLDASMGLPFPLDSRLRASALSDDLQCALARAVSLGPDLAPFRRQLLRTHRHISDAMRALSEKLNGLMPATVARI